jgi:hypothetical protein
MPRNYFERLYVRNYHVSIEHFSANLEKHALACQSFIDSEEAVLWIRSTCTYRFTGYPHYLLIL